MIKNVLTLSTLSLKVALLLCVSCMGFMGVVQDTFADEGRMPCHQEVVEDTSHPGECDMCEVALDVWTQDTVLSADVSFDAPVVVIDFFVWNEVVIDRSSVFENYQAYNPPPAVLVKSVTPLTKTIVLLS